MVEVVLQILAFFGVSGGQGDPQLMARALHEPRTQTFVVGPEFEGHMNGPPGKGVGGEARLGGPCLAVLVGEVEEAVRVWFY